MPAKKQYSQAARAQGILRILGTRQGITIGELTEEFGVTKRTLYRDLAALGEAGYPLLPKPLMEHPGQKIKELKDGRILFSLSASGKEEIKAWIWSFGPKVRVLSSKSLRGEIKIGLSRALSDYG